MNAVAKNVLLNAAKATNQDTQKTLELAARSLTEEQLKKVRSIMEAGIHIDHNTIAPVFKNN